jgi:hypothetical protein
MKIFKVFGNTIAAIGKTIEDSAELVSSFVGEDGLKHTSRQSLKLVNTALDESVEMALVESEYNLKQFRKEHGMLPKPKKNKVTKKIKKTRKKS